MVEHRELIERLMKLDGPDRRIVGRLDRTGDCWLWTGTLDKRKRHWTQVDPKRAREVGEINGRKNTWTKGGGNPKAKLSEEDIAAIRASGDGPRALAKRFGVHRTTIQRIRRGALWA